MSAVLTGAGLDELRTSIRGDVIGRDDPGYEDARQVYNAMIDKHPAVIARCQDVADVQSALAFARDEGLEVAIRGGGHSAAGLGTVDDGLVIDLSPQRWVRVDPEARTVQAGTGCTFGDVDHATHAFGLVVPGGVISTTGIGGLTLGGGTGYLSRRFGLTIDNLLAADVVLADGTFVRASEEENAELFWALRGGGGNFGVVTAFTYRAHELSTVVAGPMLWPLDQAEEAMAFYADFLGQADDDLSGVFAFLIVPAGPPFPEHLHSQPMVGIVWCYTGDPSQADAVLAPARALGPPALDGVMEMPFPALQSAFDALYPPGLQNYWRADFVTELTPEAIATYVEHCSQPPTPLSGVHLYAIDGAAGRVGPDDTAFHYRDARWAQVIFGTDPDPANADRIRSWARDAWDAVHPFASAGGGAYINFVSESDDERLRASYRDNYDRLARVKRQYDPDNVFHVNWNIAPA